MFNPIMTLLKRKVVTKLLVVLAATFSASIVINGEPFSALGSTGCALLTCVLYVLACLKAMLEE